MLLQRSLRAQLLSLMAGGLILVLLIALACFRALSGGVGDYRALVEGTLRISSLVDAANVEFKVQVQEWKNVLLRGADPASHDKYWGSFQTQEGKVQMRLDEAKGLAEQLPDSALRDQLDSLISAHRTMGEAYRKGHEQFLAAGANPGAGDAAVKGMDRAPSEQMTRLVQGLRERSGAEAAQISDTADRTLTWGLTVLLLSSLLVGLFSLWLVNRKVINPVKMLIDHVEQLSQGNFTRYVDVNRQDELGRLAQSSNILRDYLAATFQRLKQSTDELDSASRELNAIASVMAEGSQEQFERTDQVATAMHEMSATAQEVARHAADAAQAADAADTSARDGQQVMQETISTITHVSDEITSTVDVIRRLQEDSNRIGTVLEVIRGIAEQTNLLALNAAIEAARAGEQGRGFAVVADEVRNLARRTAESTAEIHQIIDTVQTGAINAVRAIESGQARSANGVEQVNAAGAVLSRITEAVEAIRDMNRQIATAAEEQTSVAEDISRNLTEITSIAATNQNNVERTQQTSQRLRGVSQDLGDACLRMSA